MEVIVIAVLIFLGIIVLAAMLFGGWVLIAIVRLIGRGIGALTGRPGGGQGLPPPHLVRCGHARCRADSPKGARFCRRCGKMIQPADERGVVSRAAVW